METAATTTKEGHFNELIASIVGIFGANIFVQEKH